MDSQDEAAALAEMEAAFPVRLRLGPPRWVVAFVVHDQLDFGEAHAGTCGHHRQTAATRCAKVRSPP